MKKKLVNIIIRTFNIANLEIVLPSLHNLTFKFRLIIHNDNPNFTLNKNDINVRPFKMKELYIINEKINQGMFMSMINSYKYIADNELDADFVILMDDDDIFLPFTISEDFVGVKLKYNCYILDKLSQYIILTKSKYKNLDKMFKPLIFEGVHSTVFRQTELLEFVNKLEEFLPILKNINGTLYVNSGEDSFFDLMFQHYHKTVSSTIYFSSSTQVSHLYNKIDGMHGRYTFADPMYAKEDEYNKAQEIEYKQKMFKCITEFKNWLK